MLTKKRFWNIQQRFKIGLIERKVMGVGFKYCYCLLLANY